MAKHDFKSLRGINMLALLLSLMLVILSAWSVATFSRLQSASQKYHTTGVFESACQVSKTYVNVGLAISVSTLGVSLAALVISSILIVRSDVK